jgi:hypothetical protein
MPVSTTANWRIGSQCRSWVDCGGLGEARLLCTSRWASQVTVLPQLKWRTGCVRRLTATLGLDPLKVIRRNLLEAFPYRCPAGAVLDSGDYRTAVGVAAARGEMQRAEKRGELVSISDVTATLADELAAVRSRLLAMPGRLAGKLAIMSDAVEIEAAIDEEVRGALSELTCG